MLKDNRSAVSAPRRALGLRPALCWGVAGLLLLFGAWRIVVWVTAEKNADPSRWRALPGEPAPDFVLKTTEGKPVHFRERVGRRPVVLLFGSATCPYCAAQIDQLGDMEKKYRGKVDFLFVYCKEAHPGARMRSLTGATLPVLAQTTTWEERAERAQRFARQHRLTCPFLVDEDGEASVQALYGGNPNQHIVVGVDGRVAAPIEETAAPHRLDAFLERLLAETAGGG